MWHTLILIFTISSARKLHPLDMMFLKSCSRAGILYPGGQRSRPAAQGSSGKKSVRRRSMTFWMSKLKILTLKRSSYSIPSCQKVPPFLWLSLCVRGLWQTEALGCEAVKIITRFRESQWEFPRADQDTIMMENRVLQHGGEKEFNYQL